MTASDYLAIAGLLAVMMGAPMAIMVTVLKGIRTDAREIAQRLDRQFAGIEQRVRELEAGKVSHADWVRVTTSHLNRLNSLSGQMAELSGKIDGSLGLGAGVMRIATALERKTEGHDGKL